MIWEVENDEAGRGVVAGKQGCLAERLGSLTVTGAAKVRNLAEVLGGVDTLRGADARTELSLTTKNLLSCVSPADSAIRAWVSWRANAFKRDSSALGARCRPCEQSIR